MEVRHYINSLTKLFFDPKYRFVYLANKGFFDKMSDEKYLSKQFHARMDYDIDWTRPTAFNEKLQWLKIYDRKPIYTQMVDKYLAREYVAERVGEEHLVPLLCVWEKPEDIAIEELPDKFVLKTTHGCGGMYICREKALFNYHTVIKQMKKSMKSNYYYHMREWPYKDVKPRIIAEKYMQNGETTNLQVYKVFNFGGEPRIIQTILNDKTKNETVDYFDTSWNHLDLRQNYPNSTETIPKPTTLEKMLEMSKICSKGHPFLRTDWYEVDGEVYFSEFTFYSDAGVERFYPDYWDKKLGSWITLPIEIIKD